MKKLGGGFSTDYLLSRRQRWSGYQRNARGAVTEENAGFQTGGALIVIDADANALIVASADCSASQPIVLANTGAEHQAAISGEANGIRTECNPTPSPR